MDTHTALHRGQAIHRSGSLDHIDFLFAAHTSYLTIVLDPNEQTTTISVSKRREGARDFAHIGDLILEILLLMFALGDEMVQQSVTYLRIYYLLFIYHFTI